MPRRVRDPEAMAFLRDPDAWRLFTPFVSAESSVSGAAKRAGVSLRKMYSFVQKGLRLGLLEPTRLQARKGRPIRFYRAVADAFFVAFEDMTALNLEEHLLEGSRLWEGRIHAAIARHFGEVFERAEAKGTGPWGRLYGNDDAGAFGQLTFASEAGFTKEPEVWRAEDVTPFVVGMGHLKLSYEQVRAFQAWVDALERNNLSEEGDENYFIDLMLIKLEP